MAGFLIGLGGLIFLSIENKVIGSCLFSLGLITIVIQQCNLFTGKAGYATKPKDYIGLLKILVFNIIGAFVIAFITISFDNKEIINKAELLWQSKITQNSLQLFFKAFVCGSLMFIAVDGYVKKNNLLLLIFPVMIFILSGCEHSIADFYYMFLTSNFLNLNNLRTIIIIIFGNFIGAQFINYGIKFEHYLFSKN